MPTVFAGAYLSNISDKPRFTLLQPKAAFNWSKV